MIRVQDKLQGLGRGFGGDCGWWKARRVPVEIEMTQLGVNLTQVPDLRPAGPIEGQIVVNRRERSGGAR